MGADQLAVALQLGQIAADRHFGDAELEGDGGDGNEAALAHGFHQPRLAQLGRKAARLRLLAGSRLLCSEPATGQHS
ncbi:MAG: hypothetical protein BroJett029_01670 [Alphaproteobacteria bacterium]|nr:MAG: hypothetical protein BroJett029_01670 [Alphaproteobacteria bacterium]